MNASVAMLFILTHCGAYIGNSETGAANYKICRKEAASCLVKEQSTQVCTNKFLLHWMNPSVGILVKKKENER